MFKKNSLLGNKRYIGQEARKLGYEVHPYLPELAEHLRNGTIGRREFLRTACLLGLSAGAAYSMAGTITGTGPLGAAAQAATPKHGGRLRCAMSVPELADPATFDWTEPANISRFMVEYLTRTGSDNVTRPYLAEGWEASEDLKTWRFKAREGITWSNGDAFNADDIVFNVNRWLDPATGSSNLGLFGQLVEEGEDGKQRAVPNAVEKIDDYTVQFNLRGPALAMPENFYNYPTAIVHRGFGVDYEADLSRNPIGTGPCDLTEFAVGGKAVLKKARDWWAGDFYLDEIHYIDLGEDPNAQVGALASDQVDITYNSPVNQLDVLKKLPNVVLHEAVTAQTGVIRMRVVEKPFDNHDVRRAVQLCADGEELLKIAHRDAGQIAADYHVCQIHPEYFPIEPVQRNIEKAKEHLAKAGYPDGIDLSITVGDTQGPWETAQCEAFAKQCEPAGIRVAINKLPTNQYWEVWDKTPFGLTSWTHRPLGTMVLSLAYRSGKPWNETAYSNPEFDKALDEAEATLDVEERKAKMEKPERILQDSGIMVQPFWRSVFKAAHKRVKGHVTHPTFYHQFHNVWIDDNA